MPDHPRILLFVCKTETDAQNRIGLIGDGFETEINSVQDDIIYDAKAMSDGVVDTPSGKFLLIAKKRP
jgi:hypothetical protein